MPGFKAQGLRSSPRDLPSSGGCSRSMFAFRPIFLVSLAAIVPATSPSDSDSDDAIAQQNLTQLVGAVVHNEIEMQLTDTSLWCFREHKQEDGKPGKTLEVCQTKDGEVDHLIAVDGRELNADELRAEDQRVQKLISHPEQLRAKQKKQRDDAEQARTMLKLFPDAFRFQRVSSDGDLVRLAFRPNASFHASTRVGTAFHHMEGTAVIDTKRKRFTEINGMLTSEVKFGGGFLGHLDKGGTFVATSGEVAPGHWDTTRLDVQMSGKALLFKTIAVHDLETYTDYTRVPADASLQEVADLLRRECNAHTASARNTHPARQR
jgi:hypothetical protein